MRNCTVDSVLLGRGCAIRCLTMIAMTALAMFLPSGTLEAETRWTPSIQLEVRHDDNVLFEGTDPVDDYVYLIQPGAKVEYKEELTQFSADGRVGIRRYQDNDDLNDEKYSLNLNGSTKFTQRFNMRGRYDFIKDNTLDSELLETGRIFFPEDRFSHKVMLNPNFNLTERTSIGVEGRYRNVSYDADTYVDYSAWSVELPLKRRLATQLDTVYISPGYAYRDSNTNRSKSYNFRIGWDHETTERLTLNLSVGARYTEHESLDTGETDENWGGLGALQFNYDFETGKVWVDFERDLKNTANGDQAEVSKVSLRLRWNFTERLGLELDGNYYYTKTEGEANNDSTEFIQAGPNLFYHLTEDHELFIAYEYSQENQKDLPDTPRAERNRIWAGVRLNFPM